MHTVVSLLSDIGRRSQHEKKSCFLFKANGHCVFSGCGVVCHLTIPCEQTSEDLTVRVEYEGRLNHKKEEKQARHICGSAREQMVKTLSHYTPTYVRHQAMAAMPPDVFVSGNRDGVGASGHVLQKIASEAKKSLRFDGNHLQSLLLLREQLRNEDNSSHVVKGYIQHISIVPFTVIAFNEASVRLYHDLCADSVVHCDATGTIVANVTPPVGSSLANEEEKRLLYYCLVVPHPRKGEPPLAVAEMVSAEHSALAISTFIARFRRAESLIYNYKQIIPRTVVIDRSLVLLIAFLKEYNNETVKDFINRAFKLVTKQEDTKGMLCQAKVNPHACTSHVMKDAKQLCSRYVTKRECDVLYTLAKLF